MFDILFYLVENFFPHGTLPDNETITRKLSDAGFEEDDISEDMDEEESDIDEERRDSEEDGDNDSSGDDDSDSSGDEDAAIETERLRLERREKRINSQYEDPGNSRQFTTTGSRRRRRG